MTKYHNQYFDGERPLFAEHDAQIEGTTFGEGESPLKESRNIDLTNSFFTWKYPLWYSQHVKVDHTVFETMARSGIWYTNDITITNSALQAPKLFRRCEHVNLAHVHFSDAQETLWTCQHITLSDVQANGDYFGKDSSDIKIDHLNLIGNYAFDGAKNIEVHDSTFVTKDAFWNCDNVTIVDSTINGEYLGWNTKNFTLINCTIKSDQGLCYIDHLTMKHCRLLETDLAFEYCRDIDAQIDSHITSVKNPISGKITADSIGELIMDPTKIDASQTTVVCKQGEPRRVSA